MFFWKLKFSCHSSSPSAEAGMKLDVNALRYLSKDDFRVLTAVELGMRNVLFLPLSVYIYIYIHINLLNFVQICSKNMLYISAVIHNAFSTKLYLPNSSTALLLSSNLSVLFISSFSMIVFISIIYNSCKYLYLFLYIYIYRHGGSYKVLKNLLKHKLLHHDSSKCMPVALPFASLLNVCVCVFY